MGCCDKPFTLEPDEPLGLAPDVNRRGLLKGVAAAAGAVATLSGSPSAQAQAKRIKLAFCGQLLCVVPYEVARANGHFANEGLDVELVYTRGGNAAMQALVAAVTSPARAAEIQGIENLAGRTVGVSALGNADHALMLFLLRRANVDPNSVRFATMGTNLLEAVRQGQVDVGLVQEPALTLIERAGGRVLVNGMDSKDAEKFLGGAYEFMGVA